MALSKNQKTHEKMHSLVQDMISKMEKGGSEWMKPWSAPFGLPQNFTTGKAYRGMNVINLLDTMDNRGYTAPYFLTFNQAKKLGGKIKKGAKSIPVFFYKPIEIKEEDPESGEEIEKTIPLLKEFKVFNIEETEGIDYTLPEIVENDNDRFEAVEEFIEKTGAKIQYKGSSAFYRRDADFIRVPKLEAFKDSDNFYSTVLHELTHWTGAADRLDRKKGKKFGDSDYAFEELVAELGSLFLGASLGINVENCQHPEYLKNWVEAMRQDPQILWKAASEAQKAFDFLHELQTAEAAA